MASLRGARADLTTVTWLAVGLALAAALGYVLIGLNLLAIGDLQPSEAPPTIVYVAATCYAVGGLLILAQRRALWIAGAAINALVIVFFAQLYLDRTAVLLSPGGIATKSAQILLEAVLLYLILNDRRALRHQP